MIDLFGPNQMPEPGIPWGEGEMELPPPVFAWLGGPGAGTLAWDASGNGNHGTLMGTTLPTWGGGVTGHRLQFVGGADDYVNVPNAPQHNSVVVSIAAGVRRDTATGVRGIIEKTDGTGYDAWNFYFGGTQKLTLASNNAGSAITAATVIPVGTLQHVGFTAQPGTNLTTLYLNGVPDVVGTVNTSLWLNVAYNLRLGALNGAAGSLNGSLEYLYVWNQWIAPNHMASIAADPFAGFRPSQQWWYGAAGGGAGITVSPDFASRVAAALGAVAQPGAVMASPGLASRVAAAFAPTAIPGTVTALVAFASHVATALEAAATAGGTIASPAMAQRTAIAQDATATAGGIIVYPLLAGHPASAFAPTVQPGTVTASVLYAGRTATAYLVTAHIVGETKPYHYLMVVKHHFA